MKLFHKTAKGLIKHIFAHLELLYDNGRLFIIQKFRSGYYPSLVVYSVYTIIPVHPLIYKV